MRGTLFDEDDILNLESYQVATKKPKPILKTGQKKAWSLLEQNPATVEFSGEQAPSNCVTVIHPTPFRFWFLVGPTVLFSIWGTCPPEFIPSMQLNFRRAHREEN